MTIRRRLFIANIFMVLSPIVVTAIIFFSIRFIIVDPDAQTRGGLGGRFTDMPSIPVVGLSEAEVAFMRGNFVRVASDVALYHSDLGDYIIIVSDTYWAAIVDFLGTPDLYL